MIMEYDVVYKNLVLNHKKVDIAVKDGKIACIGDVASDGVDCKGLTVRQGLFDIHTHGMLGIDTMDGRIDELLLAYAKAGTTSVCPTTTTESQERMIKIIKTPVGSVGARFRGYHLEGPFINPDKQGGLNGNCARLPNLDEFNHYDNISLITRAPELEGAIDYIKNSRAKVSIGHTVAGYDKVRGC